MLQYDVWVNIRIWCIYTLELGKVKNKDFEINQTKNLNLSWGLCPLPSLATVSPDPCMCSLFGGASSSPVAHLPAKFPPQQNLKICVTCIFSVQEAREFVEFSRSKGFAIVSASNPSSPAKKPFNAVQGIGNYCHMPPRSHFLDNNLGRLYQNS